MDVYRKVLVELYKETGGNTSEQVNFLELVKRKGFFPSYADIVKELSYRSWIYEDKHDKVKITHWGVDEAKKAMSRAPDADRTLKKEANRLAAETKELAAEAEKAADEISPEKIAEIEKKLGEISEIIEKIKANF